MRIAYLVNQYPKTSHSFIRREILAHEAAGFEIIRIALRGWDETLVDREDHAERARTRYVLHLGALRLAMITARMLLIRPVRFLRALCLAWRSSRHSDRPLLVHLVYLAEACCVETWLCGAGVEHLHAHFGTNSAQVAMLVHALGGCSWSFTVHGPEEFDRAPLISLAEKIRDCAFVVAVSFYGRSQLYRLASLKDWPKIHVIRCGLDRAFYEAPITPLPAARRLVCVGRLCHRKGQVLLVEAAHRLAIDGIKLELVLVGDGELRRELETLIARYTLLDNIRITGWSSGEKVRKEILEARALVLPSFAEGLPVVLMEAMALRRPVISTYVAGIPELVTPHEHGWLVPAGDVEALAQAMRICVTADIGILARMGATARRQALAYHDANKEAAKLAHLFKAPNARVVL